MAKKLSIITAGGNLPFANNGLRLSENILIEKIEEHEKFKNLFSIDKALLDRIASDMEKNSFDSSQPVHIWVTKDDDGTEHSYLIDGYTRVEASRITGIKMIPYFKHTFETFEEAYRYALHLQTDRRKLSGIDLLKNIRELMGSDYIQSLEGNKNEAIGKELGISEKTVERANKVNSMASDEQIERIENGEASPNQIYNEIRRGSKQMYRNRRHCYRADFGQEKYETNRMSCHRTGKFRECAEFFKCVESNFTSPLKKWSVDASAGRLRTERIFTQKNSVCTKTLYNWIHRGLMEVKVSDLPESLCRKRHISKNRAGKMRLGASIDSRPAEVATRKTFGHWEIDTVIGKKKGKNSVVLTLAERNTDFYITRKIPAKAAEAVNPKIRQIKEGFGAESEKIFRTLISDRGLEFASLAELEKNSETKVYFAHPYSSYERGINERHNRILRRFIPKGAYINKIPEEELERIEDLINGLPRKRLGYKTPEELFNEQLDLIYRL